MDDGGAQIYQAQRPVDGVHVLEPQQSAKGKEFDVVVTNVICRNAYHHSMVCDSSKNRAHTLVLAAHKARKEDTHPSPECKLGPACSKAI